MSSIYAHLLVPAAAYLTIVIAHLFQRPLELNPDPWVRSKTIP